MPGGTITLTNGTLNGGSSVIHVGAFSMGAGSFAVGSGTVVFDGTASQALPFSGFAGLRLEDPAENNLVGYWKLDEGQGTTLQDSSGHGNTGAASTSGVSWQTGASAVPSTVSFDDNAALTFNGFSGYAQLGANNIPATNAARHHQHLGQFHRPGGEPEHGRPGGRRGTTSSSAFAAASSPPGRRAPPRR